MDNFYDSDIVFVADMFLEEYGGGAERTTEALFGTSPYNIIKVKSSQVTKDLIEKGIQKKWVFFNYREMDHNLIPMIVGNLQYFIVEYDYKFCHYRSVDLHKRETGNNCDCHDTQLGKIISAFLHGSDHIFWMSKDQSEVYHERFPFLKDNNQTVLSSVFSVGDLEYIERLRSSRNKNGWSHNHWAVIDGNSWIKGVKESIESVNQSFPECSIEVLGGLSYYDLLKSLSQFQGLSFQPLGKDTCPRTVIEAKLLGLELLINENVQHKSEEWFNKELDEIESYLLEGHNRFWDRIKESYESNDSLSGYTTTYNVIRNDYPWKESIYSMLNFCDEVIVVDGGSDDGTWEELLELKKENKKLKVFQVKRDWSDYRFALYDYQQKSIARSLCSGDWCWQMDIDEIVHENEKEKIRKLLSQIPKPVNVVCLPVIDYWGSDSKIRLDVHPWKWRLSRNDPRITHDIPREQRRYDEKGNLYSAGSDGCDYVFFDNYQLVPSMNFYTNEYEKIRQYIANPENYENEDYQQIYDQYVNFIEVAVDELPAVHHYSWFDIKRKIYNYRDFWSKFHASLYNKEVVDSAENNKFFNKPWSDVSEEEIDKMADLLNKEFGGWIFHQHLNVNLKTNWYSFKEDKHPKYIKNWIDKKREQK